jgi:hypothetical protein
LLLVIIESVLQAALLLFVNVPCLEPVIRVEQEGIPFLFLFFACTDF